MAPLSSFSPSIWRPLTFSSLEPLLALETAWRSSRPFLRQFGALTSSSLEHLLALETAWRPSRPFLRQFGAPDVFFIGAPACTWNCMAPLLSFSPSIWRPWRLLSWSPCLHLKLHGAPLVLFSVNLTPLTFSLMEPLLALETAWRPSRQINLTFFLSFFFLAPSFFPFSLLFPSFPFFPSFLPSLFLSLSFFLSFWRPFGDPGGPGPPKPPPQDTPLLYGHTEHWSNHRRHKHPLSPYSQDIYNSIEQTRVILKWMQ